MSKKMVLEGSGKKSKFQNPNVKKDSICGFGWKIINQLTVGQLTVVS